MVRQAIEQLSRGGVLAYPTETLWGLGADITQEAGLERIYEIKGRENTKALSVLVRDVQAARDVADFGIAEARMMYLYWPGPVTFVLPAKPSVSSRITGGGKTVGLRCSPHPFVHELLSEYPHPITTTSANESGQPSALEPADLKWLPDDVVVVGEDKMTPSNGSTVLGWKDGDIVIFREGEVSGGELKESWKKIAAEEGL